MKNAHENLKITENAFDKTVVNLGAALSKFKMTDDDIQLVALKLSGLKKDIVEIPNEPVRKCWC